MPQPKQPTRSSPRTLLLSALGFSLAASLGVLLAIQLGGSPASEPEPGATKLSSRPLGAYRPNQRHSWSSSQSEQPAQARAGDADDDAKRDHADSDGVASADADLDALPPALEARLRRAARVSTIPPDGAPPPPAPGSLPPESEAARQHAMIDWQKRVQTTLDRCVARPAELRKPTSLEVILTPPADGTSLASQLLAPAAVSLPPDELRRLWRDTDPDALDGCLREVRALALAVTPLPGATARVLPASFERLVVQL